MPNAFIQNGTGSRTRTVKQPPAPWTCPICRRENARWAGNCPNCFEKRP